jgi:hypothetical protein
VVCGEAPANQVGTGWVTSMGTAALGREGPGAQDSA